MKTLFSGALLALGLLLGVATQANADTCANAQSSYNTDITIGDSGTACVINHPVTSTGSITVLGTSITTQALTSGGMSDLIVTGSQDISLGAMSAGGNFSASTSGGKISTTAAVNSNQGGAGGNIIMSASGNVSVTGDINTNGGTATGGVEIDANTGGGNTLFTIGGSSANGVSGSIITSNTTGGGTQDNFVTGGLFINNGNASSTGGITIVSMSNIQVNASQSRSGLILLNAQKGTITLPAGTLSTKGATGQGAGVIQLLAQTVTTANGTILDASQDTTASGTYHGVIIAAKTVNVAGSSGLTVHADGNGVSGVSNSAYADFIPQGAISISSNGDLHNLLWTTNYTNAYTTDAPVTIAGSSGAFTATANGNDAAVIVSGHAITFSNGVVKLTSQGTSDHQVQIYYGGALTGATGLTMSGNGAITLDASGMNAGDAGGTVLVQVDKTSITATKTLTIHADGKNSGTAGTVNFFPSSLATLSTPTVLITANNGTTTSTSGTVNFQPTLNGSYSSASITSTSFTINANGPSTGSGNAGAVNFYTSSLSLGSSTKAVLTANGSKVGNGGTVQFQPGTASVKLGTNAGDIQILANGGATSGNAGTVNVNPSSGNITIDTANAVSASVPGSSGQGGNVTD